MKLNFEMEEGRSFAITLDFGEVLVSEIKARVQQEKGIPISKQILFFNGKFLPDDGNIYALEIFSDSCIRLLLDEDLAELLSSDDLQLQAPPPQAPMPPPTTLVNWNELENMLSNVELPPPPPPPQRIIQLDVKSPASKDRVPIMMDLNETVLRLKEEIIRHEDMQGVVVDKIALHTTPVELLDHQLLKDCGVSDNPEIDVFIKPSLPVAEAAAAVGGSSSGGSDKLKITVLSFKTKEKIPLKVNAKDNVGVLREELEQLRQLLGHPLPENGRYFLIHKQKVMHEDKSFKWHRVKQGDTIIFNGLSTDPPTAPPARKKRK